MWGKPKRWFWVVVPAIFMCLAPLGTARAGWPEQDKLTASDGASGDHLGCAVSISGDYAIVGAPYDDDNGTSSGSAYVFESDGNDPNWIQQDKLIPSDNTADDLFGISISVSGDYTVIGASHSDDNGTRSGSAYIFKRSDDHNDPNWYEQTKLLADDGVAYDYFGGSVSISGDYLIVGASRNDGVAYKSGSAYIFKRSDIPNDPNWYQQDKLTALDGTAYDWFGESVSISGDYAVVGSKIRNAAYIFKRNDGDPNWTQQVKLTGSREFGVSVSISGDYAIVGAWEESDVNNGPYSGAAYIFKRSDIPADSNWYPEARLIASDGDPDDYFGGSVSIRGDYVIVGVPSDDGVADKSGSAYIFRRDGTSWTQQVKLVASDGVTRDFFGMSVSISQDYAVTTSTKNGNGFGSAYVFKQVVCPIGDLNGTCYVNINDLVVLVQQWLGAPGIPSADIAMLPDGIVSFLDYAVFAGNWLECGVPWDPNCQP